MQNEFFSSPLFVCGSIAFMILFVVGGSVLAALYERELEKQQLEKDEAEDKRQSEAQLEQFLKGLWTGNRRSQPLPTASKPQIAPVYAKGYVYLLKSPTGHYKIGKATYPEKRLKEIELLLPFDVERVHLIDCTDYNRAEMELHRRFADKRTNGEWFLLTEEDVETIKAIKAM